MPNMCRVFVTVLGLLAISTDAHAQTWRGVVAPGQEVVIATPYAFNGNCEPEGVIVQTTRPPSLGVLSTRRTTTTVQRGYGSSGTAFAMCLGRSMRATQIVYRAGPTAGRDGFSFMVYLGPEPQRVPVEAIVTIRPGGAAPSRRPANRPGGGPPRSAAL